VPGKVYHASRDVSNIGILERADTIKINDR
jgi:hypothetical protein